MLTDFTYLLLFRLTDYERLLATSNSITKIIETSARHIGQQWPKNYAAVVVQ